MHIFFPSSWPINVYIGTSLSFHDLFQHMANTYSYGFMFTAFLEHPHNIAKQVIIWQQIWVIQIACFSSCISIEYTNWSFRTDPLRSFNPYTGFINHSPEETNLMTRHHEITWQCPQAIISIRKQDKLCTNIHIIIVLRLVHIGQHTSHIHLIYIQTGRV